MRFLTSGLRKNKTLTALHLSGEQTMEAESIKLLSDALAHTSELKHLSIRQVTFLLRACVLCVLCVCVLVYFVCVLVCLCACVRAALSCCRTHSCFRAETLGYTVRVRARCVWGRVSAHVLVYLCWCVCVLVCAHVLVCLCTCVLACAYWFDSVWACACVLVRLCACVLVCLCVGCFLCMRVHCLLYVFVFSVFSLTLLLFFFHTPDGSQMVRARSQCRFGCGCARPPVVLNLFFSIGSLCFLRKVINSRWC